MLVAGASVSLLAPIAAQASDVLNLKPSTLDSSSFTNNNVEDIAELKSLVKELQSKIDDLYNAITPLLNNLKKNPEKEYILWPDRLNKVEQFEDYLTSIYQK